MLDVTAAIIEKDGLVLAARRKAQGALGGFWEFPGGRMENDETPEECLARELQEEFGIEAVVGAFVSESVYDYSGKIVRLLAYRATHRAGEFKPVDHDEIRWLLPDQLHRLTWAPADIPLVRALPCPFITNARSRSQSEC